MVPASDVNDLPRGVRLAMGALGFQYLKLRTFAVAPGTLEVPVEREPEPTEPATTPTEAPIGEPVSATA
jgi:hypothetical protein